MVINEKRLIIIMFCIIIIILLAGMIYISNINKVQIVESNNETSTDGESMPDISYSSDDIIKLKNYSMALAFYYELKIFGDELDALNAVFRVADNGIRTLNTTMGLDMLDKRINSNKELLNFIQEFYGELINQFADEVVDFSDIDFAISNYESAIEHYESAYINLKDFSTTKDDLIYLKYQIESNNAIELVKEPRKLAHNKAGGYFGKIMNY